MKRSIWIFLLAIVLPSIGLGWLALRSANEQQIILERRTAELYQKETDAVAVAARSLIEEERRGFAQRVRQLLANSSAPELARDFAAKLARAWPRPAIGFALNAEGNLISPSAEEAQGDAERKKFLLENSAFLSGSIPATVYSVPADELNRPSNGSRRRRTNPTTRQRRIRSQRNRCPNASKPRLRLLPQLRRRPKRLRRLRVLPTAANVSRELNDRS